MVIFHSYVSLPEGIHNLYASLCARWLDIIISGICCKVWQLKSWSRSKRNGSGDSRRVAHRLKDVVSFFGGKHTNDVEDHETSENDLDMVVLMVVPYNVRPPR